MAKHGKTSTTSTTATGAAAKSRAATSAAKSGNKGHSTGQQTEALTPLDEVKFDAMRSALYHGAREHCLSLLHRCAMAAGLLAGATAITSTLDGLPKGAILTVGVVVSLLTVFDLVFDWSGTAIQHVKLRERFYGILADAELCRYPDRDCARLRARLAEAYQEEPPIYHALNELMWNRTYEALAKRYDRARLKRVAGWRLAFAQILPQRGHDFSPSSIK